MSKSAIYLDREYKWRIIDGEQAYRAPFTLSEQDQNIATNSIVERMVIALEKNNRVFHFIAWPSHSVAYTKKKS